MKAEIKIPKGWKRLRVGTRVKPGDMILQSYTDGVTTFLDWKDYSPKDYEYWYVEKNQAIIRNAKHEDRG